ncbi:MAG: hypothetical protein CL912_33625 [Deltaproteobacteria bacterium]|nr:hypothetical protein [Deltaproteobacteria bacterium]
MYPHPRFQHPAIGVSGGTAGQILGNGALSQEPDWVSAMQDEKDQGMKKLCFIPIGLLFSEMPTRKVRSWPLVESSQHKRSHHQHPALKTVTNLSQFASLPFLLF